MNDEMSFEEWIEEGYIRGWIGPPICHTHDGVPMTSQEEDDFDAGSDPCVHILRLYEDEGVKRRVELSHSPSVWRAANMGLEGKA